MRNHRAASSKQANRTVGVSALGTSPHDRWCKGCRFAPILSCSWKTCVRPVGNCFRIPCITRIPMTRYDAMRCSAMLCNTMRSYGMRCDTTIRCGTMPYINDKQTHSKALIPLVDRKRPLWKEDEQQLLPASISAFGKVSTLAYCPSRKTSPMWRSDARPLGH